MGNFYLICWIISCVLSVCYVSKWNKNYNGHITFLFMMLPIAIFGFYERSVARTVEQAIVANKLTYIGLLFAPISVGFCKLHLCKIRLTRIAQTLLYSFTVLIFAMSLTPGLNDWFYKSVTMEIVDGVCVLYKEYNFTHTLFYMMLIGYLIAGILALVYALRKRKEISKVTIGLLLLVNVFTMVAFFMGGLYKGVSFVPVGYIVSMILLLVVSDRLVLYNVDDTVMQTMMKRGDIGVVSFDLKHRFLGCNNVAKKYYPSLEKLVVDKSVDEHVAEMDLLRECRN